MNISGVLSAMKNSPVIPAKAGIQEAHDPLDSRFRGNDRGIREYRGRE
jgi:hypothetical protein